MTEDLAHPVPRWFAVGIAVALAGWLCYGGVRHAVASHFAGSSDTNDWTRAADIEPSNPENWYRLGRDRALNFDESDLPSAISDYRRAVQLNPRSPYYKLDLASALEMSGNDLEADNYFRGAQADYPISAEVSWRYGNFLLRQQRMPAAYAEIHRAVMVDPKLLPLAVSRIWHSDPDVHVLVDQVLPDTEEADWQALSFLAGAQEPAAALTIWHRLISRKPAIDWKKLYMFTDMLVAREHFEDAASVWRQATSTEDGPSSSEDAGSLIFNGGFEKDISNGGFGWQQADVPGAEFDFDTEEKHSGTRSARLVFDGTQNLDCCYLYQFVLVSPGTHYRFQAYLHTDKISTENGMRFEISDPKNMQKLDVLTPNETGSIPWTLEQVDFTPGPGTHVVKVQLRRMPSQRFDNTLRGTVWVDDVRITPVGSPE